MPFLLLLIIAVSAGLAATWLTRLYARRPTVLEAASEAGRHATGPVARRALQTAQAEPEKATGLALTLTLAAVFLGGALLAVLAVLVRNTDALAGLDNSVAEWGNKHATAWTHDALTAVTDLAYTWTVIVVAIAVAAIEIARTRSRSVVPFLLVVMLGATLLTEALKDLVDRARPTIDPVAATLGPSFPSGHSSTAAASYAAFALVASRWCAPRLWPALAGTAAGIAVGVAVSRVMLDVHWLSDVIAGLALGWAWFAACAIAFGGRALRFGATARAVRRVR